MLPVFLLFVGAGAALFRIPSLDSRPMHADESVQAAIARDLWQSGTYAYDPNEFHGPTLPYATLVSLCLSGHSDFSETTEATYRIVPAVFGAGLVLLLWFLADGLGRTATGCAAVLMAISTPMVYYSRYFIHETLLVFFTLAAIAAGYRYFRSGRWQWCVAAGVCVGLMQATKETCALSYLAAFGALFLEWLHRRFVQGERGHRMLPRPVWHLGLSFVTAVVVAALFLSSFFANPRGPLDGLLTYLPWLGRAGGGAAHGHLWYDYFIRLGFWRVDSGPIWSEGLILTLAAVGLLAAFVPNARRSSEGDIEFLRWTGFYTVGLAAAYSVIPYKTPWCLLQFLLGMILLAGVGAATLVRARFPFVAKSPRLVTNVVRSMIIAGLLAACGHLIWQSYRASYVFSADPRNPYVYAHTLPSMTRFAKDIEELRISADMSDQATVQVVWPDPYYWPLPWYLRRFEQVEYWDKVPEAAPSPFVISSPQFDEALTKKLDETHLMTGFYGLRPGVLAQLWVRMDVWETHLRRLGRL